MTSDSLAGLGRIIKKARRDPEAFSTLYDLFARDIYRYCFSRAGNHADAEDLTAQTFIAVMEGLSNYKEQGKFKAWLFSIAHNLSAGLQRKNKNHLPLEAVNLVDRGESPLGHVIQLEKVQLASKLINELDPEEQELLRLRYLVDLSFTEIGHILGIPPGTAKKALYRLKDRLQTLAAIQGAKSGSRTDD